MKGDNPGCGLAGRLPLVELADAMRESSKTGHVW